MMMLMLIISLSGQVVKEAGLVPEAKKKKLQMKVKVNVVCIMHQQIQKIYD